MITKKGGEKATIIKKYANRRLYDTGRSSYVTLDDLCQMIKEGYDFVVHDAKTGEDLTRSVLAQIIVEQEAKGGQNLLPVSFMRQLIGFYGDNMGKFVPNYLEQAFNDFTEKQEQFREQLNKSFGGIFPMNGAMTGFEEMRKQNMALFEQALKTFANFGLNSLKGNGAEEKK